MASQFKKESKGLCMQNTFVSFRHNERLSINFTLFQGGSCGIKDVNIRNKQNNLSSMSQCPIFLLREHTKTKRKHLHGYGQPFGSQLPPDVLKYNFHNAFHICEKNNRQGNFQICNIVLVQHSNYSHSKNSH